MLSICPRTPSLCRLCSLFPASSCHLLLKSSCLARCVFLTHSDFLLWKRARLTSHCLSVALLELLTSLLLADLRCSADGCVSSHCLCVYLCSYTPLCLSCVCIIALLCCTRPVCVFVCVYILAGRRLTVYLSEGCADSANQCCVSSARRSCTCQRACPGCKCRKIVCLSERIHNICLIMNASARSITCPEDRDGRL